MQNKRKKEAPPVPTREFPKSALLKIGALVALCAVLVAVYRFFLETPYFLIVFGLYMAALIAFVIVFLIYNRGMSRKGITEDMLPDTWSDEEKKSFVEDGKRRLDRSKWMLLFIVALLFVFIADACELFVLPMLEGIFQWQM